MRARACSRKKTRSFCYPCARLPTLLLYCQLYWYGTTALHLSIKAIPRLASWRRCSGARTACVFVSPSLPFPLIPTHVPAYHHPRTTHAQRRRPSLRTTDMRRKDTVQCQLSWSSFRTDSGLSHFHGTNQPIDTFLHTIFFFRSQMMGKGMDEMRVCESGRCHWARRIATRR